MNEEMEEMLAEVDNPEGEELTCPSCGEVGFDRGGLDYHRSEYCKGAKMSEQIDYDTIDGKWWLFEDKKAIRPLTDDEAAGVIWSIEKHSIKGGEDE